MNNLNTIRLAYYMWVPLNFGNETSEIYNLHINCLKEYASLFTDALFVLGMDNPQDYKAINKIEKDIVSLDFNGNISFKIIQNNPYLREGIVFYNEIVQKLNDLDGITFFAHSKGMGNIINGTFDGDSVNKESLMEWICASYYLNLNYFKSVIKTLIGNLRIAYGSMLSYNESFWGKPSWQYNGSFFWINTKKLYDHINLEKKYIPQCTDRTYAETFLGKLLPFDFNYIESYGTFYMNTDKFPLNPYKNCDEWIKCIMENNTYNNFITLKKRMCNEL